MVVRVIGYRFLDKVGGFIYVFFKYKIEIYVKI